MRWRQVFYGCNIHNHPAVHFMWLLCQVLQIRIAALTSCRVLLCWLTDLMRPGRGFQDTPVVTLGFHALSHRDMGASHTTLLPQL